MKNFKSVLESPIILKKTDIYPKVLEIDVGYEIIENTYIPCVVLRFFEKNEIKILTFDEWMKFGDAIVKFSKHPDDPCSQLLVELSQGFYAIGNFIEDRKNITRYVLTLEKNKKQFNIWKESVMKLAEEVYDNLTPIIYQIFSQKENNNNNNNVELKKKRKKNLSKDENEILDQLTAAFD